MPCLFVKRYILSNHSMSIDQKVRGNLQVFNLSEIRMRAHIESITEEIIDVTGPELTGWQANIVDDE